MFLHRPCFAGGLGRRPEAESSSFHMMSSVLGDACKWGFVCKVSAGQGQGGPMVTSHGHQGRGGDRGVIDHSLWGARGAVCNARSSDALSVAATLRRVCNTLCCAVMFVLSCGRVSGFD
jgi:hypothetical protein